MSQPQTEAAAVPMPDIECPRCGRINFGWEASRSCPQCRWVLRFEPVARPYGFDILIQIRTGQGFDTLEKHYKGTEAKARSRAKTTPKFERVLATVPLSEETWIRTYGEGRM